MIDHTKTTIPQNKEQKYASPRYVPYEELSATTRYQMDMTTIAQRIESADRRKKIALRAIEHTFQKLINTLS